MRGTSNSNARGSSYTRRARRQWLVQTWQSEHAGRCRCYRCGTLLDEQLCHCGSNRARVSGRPVRARNIRPACASCNSETGGSMRGRR